MIATPDYRALLDTAIAEARQGLAEGGIPIGAALYHRDGQLLGCGHNRRVQEGDPSVHGETDAFRKAGRQRRYRDTIMVTTLAPCWYCSGLVRQFNIGTVVVGESVTFRGGIDWLRENGVEVIDPQGEAFDALEAQAVATVDDANVPDETVAEVYQKGYKMGSKVLRPAMVTVTSGGPKREKAPDEGTKDKK